MSKNFNEMELLGYIVMVLIQPTSEIKRWMQHWNKKIYDTKEIAENVGKKCGKKYIVKPVYLIN